jgi:hypothetical protein
MVGKLKQFAMIVCFSTIVLLQQQGLAQEGARSVCEGGDRLHKKCVEPNVDIGVMLQICKGKYDGSNWLPNMNNCDTINRDMVEFLCTKGCLNAHTCYISGPNGEKAHTTGFVFLDGGKQICWIDYGQLHVCAPWVPGAELTGENLPKIIQDAMKGANYACEIAIPDLPKHPANDSRNPSNVASGLQDCLNMCDA